MNYLTINTADKLEILLKTETELQYFCADDKTLASVELLSRIQKMTEQCGIEPENLDFFAAVTGPGSFTGIRIGVTTVNALCYALNKPAIGVSLFDYIAQGRSLPLSVVINGTGGACYIKNFPSNSNVPGETCIKNEKVLELSYPKIIASSDFLPKNERIEIFSPSKMLFSAVVEKAYTQSEKVIGGLLPVYLRRAQAERDGGEL